jgi:hypothetical protein
MPRVLKTVFVSLMLLPTILVAHAQEPDDSSHAQAVLQQAADETMHYAITGRWDENRIAAVMGYTIPDGLDESARRIFVLDQLVPCTTGFDDVFFNHWGHDCEPGDHSDDDLRGSIARLIETAVFAREAAAELNPAPGLRIAGLDLGSGELNTETVSETEPGWFHVWMCSERHMLSDYCEGLRYQISGEGTSRRCELMEGDHIEQNQYDLGDHHGDIITIILFFNLPQVNEEYVQLEASISGPNAHAGSATVCTLPPQLAYPPARYPILYRHGIVIDK